MPLVWASSPLMRLWLQDTLVIVRDIADLDGVHTSHSPAVAVCVHATTRALTK